MTSADAPDDATRTRPGTPMIGPYSVNQMDDFYAALACGEVKPTGVMNYLQRLFIAESCRAGDQMVDICCGRGLQLPVLYRYRPDLAGYTGLDISEANLAEASDRQGDLDRIYQPGFPVAWHICDVAAPWPVTGPFDVAVYTSALEHLPFEAGVASLRRAAAALAPSGRLYLSTPNTPGPPPRRLQHRVHVYEWSAQELIEVLGQVGLTVLDVIGILPSISAGADTASTTQAAVAARYGDGAAAFYGEMARFTPSALLGPVVSTALGIDASEVLYVCARRPQ